MRRNSYKRPHTHFICEKCNSSVKTGKLACVYAVSPSSKIQATACNKAGKLKLTSPAECCLTNLQLRVFLRAVEGVFGCNYRCLASKVHVFLPASAGFFAWNSTVFACQLHVFLPAKAGNFVC